MEVQRYGIAMAKSLNAQFSIKGKKIEYHRVFADIGLLPGIARRADRTCTLCFGYGIGVTFEDQEKSMLGIKVIFDEVTPMILILLFIADVLSEFISKNTKKGITSLDDLIYD